MKTIKYISWLFLIASVLLYVVSLTQDAFCVGERCTPFPAIFLVLFGFFGWFAGGANLCWLANPFLMASWVKFGNIKVSFALSFLAVVAGCSFQMFHEVTMGTSGHASPILHLHDGYWYWLYSTVAMFMGNSLRMIVWLREESIKEVRAYEESMKEKPG